LVLHQELLLQQLNSEAIEMKMILIEATRGCQRTEILDAESGST
jgi:hypothetical protein